MIFSCVLFILRLYLHDDIPLEQMSAINKAWMPHIFLNIKLLSAIATCKGHGNKNQNETDFWATTSQQVHLELKHQKILRSEVP